MTGTVLMMLLGIDVKQLFFSKGIIFCEGPSELYPHEIIYLDKEIEKSSIDLVEMKGCSSLDHPSFVEFLKFLKNSDIPFLMCFDKDSETKVLEFINTNSFVEIKELLIWDKEFEEALGIDDYINTCSSYARNNPEIDKEKVKLRIKETMSSGKRLTDAVKKVFYGLKLGDYNKPQIARKTIENIVLELKNRKRSGLAVQLEEFAKKLAPFH